MSRAKPIGSESSLNAFELLKQEMVETAEVILGRPSCNNDDLFGMRYRIAISLVLVGGFLFGGFLFQTVTVGWCPTVTHDGPEPADVAFTLGRFSFVVVLLETAIVSAISLLGNFEQTWQRLGILAIAAGISVWGFWVVAIHRIEIHSDRFVVRGPINPFANSYELNNGCRIVTRFKDFRATGFRLGNKINRIYSLHYIRPDKSEKILHNGRWGPSTWSWAARRFEFDMSPFGFSD